MLISKKMQWAFFKLIELKLITCCNLMYDDLRRCKTLKLKAVSKALTLICRCNKYFILGVKGERATTKLTEKKI